MNQLHRYGCPWLVAGVVMLAFYGAVAASAQTAAETDSTDYGSSTVPLPVVAYSPDTGLMLGGSVLRFFYLEEHHPDIRPSVLSPVFIHTLKNQTLAFLGAEFNWDRGRKKAGIVPSYLRFPDLFYGIGRASRAEDEEKYTPEQIGFEAFFTQEVAADLSLGLGYTLVHSRLDEAVAGGLLLTGGALGTGRSRVSLPELFVIWDSRDHTWAPRRGAWLISRTGFSREGLGSEFRYTRTEIDLRGYIPIGEGGTLAGQIVFTSLDGDAPFFRMPRLGGDKGLRGYSAGRYLDATRALTRLEYRSGEVLGRVGWVAFAGFGDVAPRPSDITGRTDLWSAGGGLRITINRQEKVQIRMDLGFGRDSSGFFLSLGEAF